MNSYKDNFEDKINKEFWSLKRSEKGRISISDEKSLEGKSALKIIVRSGDKKEAETERSEISEKEHYTPKLLKPYKYKFSTFFPLDFGKSYNRTVFAQLKVTSANEDVSPLFSFRIQNGKFVFKYPLKESNDKIYSDITLLNKWTGFSISFKYITNRIVIFSLWSEGKLITRKAIRVDEDYKRNLTYFKMGLYRDTLAEPQIIFIDKFEKC